LFSCPLQAQNPSVIENSAWSGKSLWRLETALGISQINVAGNLYFGPQTVPMQGGPVALANNEFLFLLNDGLNESMISGTYTFVNNKLSLFPALPIDGTFETMLTSIIEAAHDGTPFNGTVAVPRLDLKGTFKQSKNGIRTLKINLSGPADFTGDISGKPLNWKTAFSLAHTFIDEGIGIETVP